MVIPKFYVKEEHGQDTVLGVQWSGTDCMALNFGMCKFTVTYNTIAKHLV